VTQTVKDEARIYIPYHDLVFVHLLAPGHPHHIHANPFPEREDQFKNAVTRGLISALLQGGAAQLGQEGINTSSLIGAMGCGVGDVCSSHSSLRDAVEGMVPGFTKDELIFRRADQGEVVLIKKSFDDEIEPMLSRCEGFGDLSRRDKNRLLDFDHPERAVTYLNDCASKLAPDQSSTQAEVRLLEPGTKFNDELRNGGQGPSMVVIPTGRYRMGDQSESNANEVPAHRVRIERPIAVSRHEITLAEFDRFTSSTGRVKRSGQLSKQQNSPVRGIAWIDAVAYAQWLSGETGHHYRLPTEAEWEYFARAGTDTKYPWGDTITSEQVRCEACGDKKPKSEDVGQFPENAYGLYDVSGGVWEWVADCWHPEYSGAPRDGSAWMHAGDCNLRVLRGGSVDDNADQLRVGFRTAYNPVSRGNYVGFRLVRDF
jgi:formylglycine-generating enzyme required for sulfatase activity